MEDVPKVYTPSCCRVFFYNSSNESFVCCFCTVSSRGEDNGWDYEKLEAGASSSAQHAPVTWRGNITAVPCRKEKGTLMISYDDRETKIED